MSSRAEKRNTFFKYMRPRVCGLRLHPAKLNTPGIDKTAPAKYNTENAAAEQPRRCPEKHL